MARVRGLAARNHFSAAWPESGSRQVDTLKAVIVIPALSAVSALGAQSDGRRAGDHIDLNINKRGNIIGRDLEFGIRDMSTPKDAKR